MQAKNPYPLGPPLRPEPQAVPEWTKHPERKGMWVNTRTGRLATGTTPPEPSN